MKKIYALFIMSMMGWTLSSQPIDVDITAPYNNPTYLVDSVLLGSGVTASNVSFTGASTAMGFFSNTSTGFPMDSGIIITSGSAVLAEGPNNQGGAGMNNQLPGAAILDAITTSTTYDASILQFDFVPQSDTISFGFIFASEEYEEYVGSSYNDVFGFFISGPRPNQPTNPYADENIALIPGTSTAVAINNVNQNLNTSYYVNNNGGAEIQYDGRTVKMSAIAHVICNQTYTIKLAISDAGDGVLDSGVFLEAASFSSSGATVTSAVASNAYTDNDTTIYEGCGSALITVKTPLIMPVDSTIDYVLGGTAQNGVDYQYLPGSVTIPAGSDSAVIEIEAIFDGVPDGDQTVEILFPFSSYCGGLQPVQLTIVILDVDSLRRTYSPPDTILCSPEDMYLYLQADGGVPPLHFEWEWNGNTHDYYDLFANVTQSTTYNYTIQDQCLGFAIEDSVVVTILEDAPDIQASIYPSGPEEICEDDSITFIGSYTGGTIDIVYGWYEDGNELTNDSILTVAPTEGSYEYMFLVTDYCGDRDSAYVQLDVKVCEVDIPNVITPNNDGTNDFFYIENGENFEDLQLWIYNRWGVLVYENLNYGANCGDPFDNGCWGGENSQMGGDCPEGTYYYVVKIPSENQQYNGTLSLFR
jgi:gliding motility-associated-like protein